MRFTTTFTIALMLIFAGCADDSSQKQNNGFDVGEQPDAGVDDTGTEDDMGVSGTITFTLVNDSSQTIFTGISGGVGSCAPFPFVRVEGADVTPRLQQDCATCVCDEEPCAVCDCAIPDRETYALAPGASREFTWDKMFWEVRFEGNACQAPRPATGSDYVAEFCFSNSYDDGDFQPTRRLCQTVDFNIDDEAVSFTVEDEEIPTNETELLITNDSGQPIYVRPNPGQCHGTWFKLQANGQPISLFESCDLCNCAEGTECAVACPAAACPPPMLEDFEVLDGEARTFVWDHTYWPQRQLDGDTCEYPSYFQPGSSMTVELCHATEVTANGDFAELGVEKCESLDFTTNDATVEYVVE